MIDPTLAARLAAIAREGHDLDGERTRLILEAREAGATLREIGDAAGMTHVGVQKLLTRTNPKETQ